MFSVTLKQITFGQKQLLEDQNPFIASNYKQAKNTDYLKGSVFYLSPPPPRSLISRGWTGLVNLNNLFTLCFLPQSL